MTPKLFDSEATDAVAKQWLNEAACIAAIEMDSTDVDEVEAPAKDMASAGSSNSAFFGICSLRLQTQRKQLQLDLRIEWKMQRSWLNAI